MSLISWIKCLLPLSFIHNSLIVTRKRNQFSLSAHTEKKKFNAVRYKKLFLYMLQECKASCLKNKKHFKHPYTWLAAYPFWRYKASLKYSDITVTICLMHKTLVLNNQIYNCFYIHMNNTKLMKLKYFKIVIKESRLELFW